MTEKVQKSFEKHEKQSWKQKWTIVYMKISNYEYLYGAENEQTTEYWLQLG